MGCESLASDNPDESCLGVEDSVIGALAPVWKANASRDSCVICASSFSLLVRRHHCRRCGELVCADCSPRRFEMRLMVAGANDTAVQRACNSCASELDERILRLNAPGIFNTGESADTDVADIGTTAKPSAADGSAPQPEKLSIRAMVIREILSTEEQYINMLTVLHALFAEPIKSEARFDAICSFRRPPHAMATILEVINEDPQR